jgi:GntR family transcriptional repressor for pyruvate dehydrogenase complex
VSKLWEPIREPGSLAERISQQIEEMIAAEQLRPGDRLPAERDLAGLLGVSRPSVREAVRSLAAQGRLSVHHGRGVFVEEPSRQRLRRELFRQTTDIDELFAMREVLEVPAAGWAAERATSAEINAIRTAFDALNRAVEQRPVDWPELQRLDAMFHEAVVLAAGNRFMDRIVGVLNEIMLAGMETTLRLPGRLEKSARDHAKLLAAVVDGDSAAARSAVRKHVHGALEAARKSFDEPTV